MYQLYPVIPMETNLVDRFAELLDSRKKPHLVAVVLRAVILFAGLFAGLQNLEARPAGPGRLPDHLRLIPGDLPLTNGTTCVSRKFHCAWRWTDGAKLGDVYLYEVDGFNGREITAVTVRIAASTPEQSNDLKPDQWYKLKIRNITAHEDPFLVVYFTTSCLPTVEIAPGGPLILCSGTAFDLNAVVRGHAWTLQWYLNGQVLDGQTQPHLHRVIADDSAGTYTAVVSNPAGQVSATEDVDLLPAVEVIFPPTGAQLTVGDRLDLFVEALGGTPERPLSYQWLKNGGAISGANAATYSINAVLLSDAGDYSVQVRGACGSAASSPATITVVPPILPPVISSQPPSFTWARVGDSLSLEVEVNNANSFQWNFSSNLDVTMDVPPDAVPLPGAKQPKLVLDSVQLAQTGTYWLTAANSAGVSVVSDPSEVVILPPLAVTITVPPPGITNIPGSPIEVQFTVSGLPTDPSNFNDLTVEFRIDGNLGPSIRQPIGNPNGSVLLTLPDVEGPHTISVTVTDDHQPQNYSAQDLVTVVVAHPPVVVPDPVIEMQPPSLVWVREGGHLELDTRERSTAYVQWFFLFDPYDSLTVVGTNSAYISDPVTFDQDGQYFLIAYNSVGVSVTSSTSTVVVLPPLEITLKSPVDQTTNAPGSQLPIQFTLTGLPDDTNGFGAFTVDFKINGVVVGQVVQPGDQEDGSFSLTAPSVPGKYQVELQAHDSLPSTASTSFTLTVIPPIVQPPPQPVLHCQRSGGVLTLSWAKAFEVRSGSGGWKIEMSSDLRKWTAARFDEPSPVAIGDSWVVTTTLASDPEVRFFRLVQNTP